MNNLVYEKMILVPYTDLLKLLEQNSNKSNKLYDTKLSKNSRLLNEQARINRFLNIKSQESINENVKQSEVIYPTNYSTEPSNKNDKLSNETPINIAKLDLNLDSNDSFASANNSFSINNDDQLNSQAFQKSHDGLLKTVLNSNLLKENDPIIKRDFKAEKKKKKFVNDPYLQSFYLTRAARKEIINDIKDDYQLKERLKNKGITEKQWENINNLKYD